ncbi:transcription elongation factor SPT4-A isoform 2 [Mus musculus]|uniref:transcription elongation factor SPT4-A isoform 2 n=1 Tax=Mus musculus TaxID=10090 RepID=UPI000049C6D3|nr:transcription elongation factor SPT4-A isoform 2 [Mus musculus]|eukprot:XP_006532804.1 PREDICTED: transcription elongation factor SPT4-A isoform X1 [Mus musculus]
MTKLVVLMQPSVLALKLSRGHKCRVAFCCIMRRRPHLKIKIIIAMMSPEDSWVSKWQRVSNFKPGVYAVSVTGRLPQGIVRELKSRGVAYKSRDTAIKT